MNVNNALLGAFVGVLGVALFTPLLSVYGFNHTTSMILLYALPFVGALSVIVNETVYFETSENRKKIPETREISENDGNWNGLIGKTVVLHTNLGGVYKGTIGGWKGNLLAMEKTIRLDLPDANLLDHLFVDKTDIKRVEIAGSQ
jgi:hypothetical protein